MIFISHIIEHMAVQKAIRMLQHMDPGFKAVVKKTKRFMLKAEITGDNKKRYTIHVKPAKSATYWEYTTYELDGPNDVKGHIIRKGAYPSVFTTDR